MSEAKDFQFVECETCRAKPGSPLLCQGCASNRIAILKLKDELAALPAACGECADAGKISAAYNSLRILKEHCPLDSDECNTSIRFLWKFLEGLKAIPPAPERAELAEARAQLAAAQADLADSDTLLGIGWRESVAAVKAGGKPAYEAASVQCVRLAGELDVMREQLAAAKARMSGAETVCETILVQFGALLPAKYCDMLRAVGALAAKGGAALNGEA